MGVQGWWGNLFQGGISAVVGGMVAALTAWFVVTATRRHERRFTLEMEARNAAISLFVTLSDIAGHLERALDTGVPIPGLTVRREWAIRALSAEIAMFSLGQEVGSKFSQDLGDLRRSLEIIEDEANPNAGLVESAISANQKLIDRLADWLMEGRHR